MAAVATLALDAGAELDLMAAEATVWEAGVGLGAVALTGDLTPAVTPPGVLPPIAAAEILDGSIGR